ncbi:MAG: alpha/beta hydrolase family protein [Planctomycetota bacterium]
MVDLRGGTAAAEKTLATALWYPTDVEAGEVRYAGGPNRGRVAPDAPIRTETPLPLLAFSHGYGGSAVGSAFLAEALAARGWIVACPDHEDRDKLARLRGGPQRIDRFAFLERASAMARAGRDFDRGSLRYRLDDVRIVLDALLSAPESGPAIDRARIAVGGHSLGGFAALALCGAIRGERDGRIAAALLFSPALSLFDEEEFSAVGVPTMILLGEKERGEVHGRLTRAELLDRAFERLPAPKVLAEIRGGTHFSFNLPSASGIVARAWSGTEEDFETIRTYAIAFLERTVAGREEAGAVLAAPDRRLSAYRVEGGEAASSEPQSQRSARRA